MYNERESFSNNTPRYALSMSSVTIEMTSAISSIATTIVMDAVKQQENGAYSMIIHTHAYTFNDVFTGWLNCVNDYDTYLLLFVCNING